LIKIDTLKKLSELFAIARYIMCESPKKAEIYMHIANNQKQIHKKLKELAKNSYVIKLKINEIEENELIIFNNGIACTVKIIPEWAVNFELVGINITFDINDNLLYKKINFLYSSFMEEYPGVFESKIDSVLKNISIYYQKLDIDINIITNAIMVQHIITSIDYNDWVNKNIQKFLDDYLNFIIHSDTLQVPFTLLFFVQISKRQKSLNLNDFEDYVLTFSRDYNASLQTAIYLQSIGDELKSKAQKQYTFQLFQKTLYEALLFYRCAYFLYDILNRCGCLDDKERINSGLYMCEEMRVLINISLRPIQRNGIPNFNYSKEFFNWLSAPFLQDGTFYDKANKEQIHDFYLRLYYPSILKNMALGCYDLLKEGNWKHIRKLELLAEDIETNSKEYLVTGEIDYLLDLYEFIGHYYKNNNQSDRADFYFSKTTSDYVTSLYASIFL